MPTESHCETKLCGDCKIEKPLDDFYKNPHTKCKECVKRDVKVWCAGNRERRREIANRYGRSEKRRIVERASRYGKNIAKYMFQLAKRRAKIRGIAFSIGLDDVVIPDFCPLLGVQINVESSDVDSRPSIDRIDNSKGYVPGNVLVVSSRGNRLKNDSSSKELMMLAKNLSLLER
jgi:hypothetical protein